MRGHRKGLKVNHEANFMVRKQPDVLVIYGRHSAELYANIEETMASRRSARGWASSG